MTDPHSVGMDRSTLSPKWQFRFTFFDTFGLPPMWKSTPQYRDALRALSFRQRTWVGMNFYAFFFGFIYLAILGLWRKSLTYLGVALAVGAVLSVLNLPEPVGTACSIGLATFVFVRANGYYYDLRVHGRHTWAL